MIFEDVHWGDPTSLEVLGRAVSRVAAHRALLIRNSNRPGADNRTSPPSPSIG
jgi:predicted ATPase